MVCPYSAIVEAAWVGKLMHLVGLSGLVVTALAWLVQNREVKLCGEQCIVAKVSLAVPLSFPPHTSTKPFVSTAQDCPGHSMGCTEEAQYTW
jgi:hypothetical protein